MGRLVRFVAIQPWAPVILNYPKPQIDPRSKMVKMLGGEF
jgi:hypothetical protein